MHDRWLEKLKAAHSSRQGSRSEKIAFSSRCELRTIALEAVHCLCKPCSKKRSAIPPKSRASCSSLLTSAAACNSVAATIKSDLSKNSLTSNLGRGIGQPTVVYEFRQALTERRSGWRGDLLRHQIDQPRHLSYGVYCFGSNERELPRNWARFTAALSVLESQMTDYAKRARSRFCVGSRKAPIELVLSGKRSLEEWVDVLDQEERQRCELRADKPSSKAREAPNQPLELRTLGTELRVAEHGSSVADSGGWL